jgi:hypothetical protein
MSLPEYGFSLTNKQNQGSSASSAINSEILAALSSSSNYADSMRLTEDDRV